MKKKKIEYNNNFENQGQCPNCNGGNLIYSTLKVEGESMCYPFVCEDCKAEGKEWYILEFEQIIVNNKE